MSLWCVFRWIMYDRKEKRRRIEQIKSKKLQVQKQRDLIDVEGQKTIASVDTVDGSSSDDDYEQYAMKIERPLFFRAISWWAYLELFIVAYTLLTKRQEDFPENFLHGFCYNNSCSRIVTRALCYKILSSVLLAFGAKLQFIFIMTPWLFINVLGIFPLSSIVLSAHYEYATVQSNARLLVSFFTATYT